MILDRSMSEKEEIVKAERIGKWSFLIKARLDLLCLIAGCGLPLAFAPFNLWFIAPVSLAVLWIGWLNVSS